MRSTSSTVQSGVQSMTISTNDITKLDRQTNGSRTSTPNLSMRHKSPSPVPKKITNGFSDFEKDCLRAHNDFRAKHRVSPLKINKKLCRNAEEWAKVYKIRNL